MLYTSLESFSLVIQSKGYVQGIRDSKLGVRNYALARSGAQSRVIMYMSI